MLWCCEVVRNYVHMCTHALMHFRRWMRLSCVRLSSDLHCFALRAWVRTARKRCTSGASTTGSHCLCDGDHGGRRLPLPGISSAAQEACHIGATVSATFGCRRSSSVYLLPDLDNSFLASDVPDDSYAIVDFSP